MKRLLLVALLVSCALPLFGRGTAKMVGAEKLTPTEIKRLAELRQQVALAQAKVTAAEKEIAKAHGMVEAHWMEWETLYEFDGDFVVQRHINHMEGITLQDLTGVPPE